MRAKTTEGAKLKRLAKKFAEATANVAVEQVSSSQFNWDTVGALDDARKKLFDEIDRITSLDLTPRAVTEEH